MTERRVRYHGGDYAPLVTEGPDGLRYEMPVSSGFATYGFEFPISEADLGVIDTDAQRAALLFGALHHPFQLRETRLTDEQVRESMRVILHAPLDDVRTFLHPRNQASRNAIYSLAGMYASLDPRFRWQDGE